MLSGGGGGRRNLAVLIRSGVLSLGRPDRMLKRVAALATFGPTMAGTYAAAAARNPNRTAVIDERRRISYRELEARGRRIATGLAGLGVGPDGSAAVLQRNSAYTVETLVALSRLGADALLLNTFLSPAQLAEVIGRDRPKVLIVDAELKANLTGLPDDLVVIIADPGDGGGADSHSLDRLADQADRRPDGTAAPRLPVPGRKGRLIILTSGTTGAPKGARRAVPKGLGPAASMLSRIGFRAPETMLIAPPLFHTWGLGTLQLAAALNGTVVLRRKPDPESLLAAVDEFGCTSLVVVPVTAQRLVELPAAVRGRYRTSTLRVVACSSAAISKNLSTTFQDTFGDVLYNIYGATEVSWVTIASPEDLRLSPGTAGRPPYGTRVEVLDDEGDPVPLGEVGDIYVGNELMFEGYTSGGDKLRRHGLLSTGDRGRIDEHGLLSVLGRDDDLVISGGENVYPSTVEELLIAHPQVREVTVIGVPDARLGQRLAAYLVLTDAADRKGAPELTADAVRDLVRAQLAAFCVPRDVVFLEELPRNATGKVVSRLLPPSSPPR